MNFAEMSEASNLAAQLGKDALGEIAKERGVLWQNAAAFMTAYVCCSMMLEAPEFQEIAGPATRPDIERMKGMFLMVGSVTAYAAQQEKPK